MSAAQRLQRQLSELRSLALGCVDCLDEGHNNASRREWDLLEGHLRTAFRNSAAMGRRQKAVLRLLRKARLGAKP